MATDVKLKLSIEGGRIVSQEIDGVTHSVGNMRGASISANASLADLGSQALALTKTFSGLIAIQKGVAAANDYAGLTSRMKLLTGSAEQAAAAMQAVADIAQRQGANLQAVGDSYAKIGQAVVAMGGTSADTARMVETVAGALRLGNASTAEAASAMRQFGQAMAKGKLNGDEFISLMENAPYLMDAVAASLGKTKGDLFAMAEAGQLTAQVFGDAVLGSFDSVTAKASTLAPTIGQAVERITTAFTVAAAESKNVGLASSTAFAAMGFAADHAAQILGVLTTGAMVALANQAMTVTSAIGAKVTATLADRAAMVANLQSTVASTEAKAIYTGMVLREAQATLAHASGLGASVVAQNAAIAATRAHTAATLAQTEAQVALSAATSLGARALGLLGGPIGAITAVLGLGLTAWSLWGSSAKEAEEKAAGAVARSTPQILADLDNQIARIERRNALAGQKLSVNGFDLNSPAAERMGEIQIQLNALEKQNGLSAEQYGTQKNKLLAEQGRLQQKLLELERASAPERAAAAVKAHTEAMAKYGPVVDKATAAIAAERAALGAAFTAEDEAKIKAHFATRKTGVATLSAAEQAAAKAKAEAHRILLANAAEHTKMVDAAIEADEKALALVEGQIKTARTMAEQIEFETRLLGLNAEQRAIASAERELERQGIVAGTVAYDAYIQRIKTAMAAKVTTQAGIDAADKLADANKKAAEESGKYWEDALMRAFESGKGFFESLWDTIKNTLKTQVLKVFVSASGIGAMGSAAAQAGTDFLGSAASSATGGFISSQAGNLAFGGATLGQLGSTFTAAFKAGWAGVDLAGSIAATQAAGMTGVSGALSAGSSIGSALGAIPGWGWAALGVAAVAGILKGHGETRSGATYDTGADGLARYQQGPSGGEIAGDTARALFDASQTSIIDTLKMVGSSATITGYTAGLESSEKGKGFAFAGGYINGKGFGDYGGRDGGQFAYQTMNAEQAMAAYVNELKKSTLEALQAATDIPAVISDQLAGVDINALNQEGLDNLMAAVGGTIDMVNGFTQAANLSAMQELHDLSFEVAAGLIAASGGMEALNTTLGTYYSNFYTEEEQRLQTIKTINAATAGSGLDAATATREQFRQIVEAQDLTTESGQQMYAALLGVSGAFAGLTTVIESVTNTAQAAYDNLERAIDAQRSIYEVQIDAAQDAVDEITSVFDVLRTSVAELYGSVGDASAINGSAFIDQALATAQKTGYLPDSTQLADAITAARGGVDSAIYASQADADFARLELAGRLDQLKTISGDQLTGADRALKVAQDQLDALDAMQATAKAQLDALDGISGMVLDIGTAMGAFEKAVADASSPASTGAVTVGGASGGAVTGYSQKTDMGSWGIVSTGITDPYEVARLDGIAAYINEVGVGSAADIQKIADAAAMYGVSQQDIANATGYLLKDVQAVFSGAGIPAFAQGTNFVPTDMLAQIHQGEAIVPAAYNPANGGAVVNTARLEALIEALTAKVAALEAPANRTANAIEGNQSRPILVEVAA